MSRSLVERACDAPGPLVIVGRPHSGTRLLARTFMLNGVFMGAALSADFLDSMSWYQRFVVPLMSSRFFPRWAEHKFDATLSAISKELFADTLRHFFRTTKPRGVWGWKFCETLFVMPIVKQLLPRAKVVHLLRDGRDVCLSDNGYFQLTSAHSNPPGWQPTALAKALRASSNQVRPTFREFCLGVTFGDLSVSHWQGINLNDRQQLIRNRFLLQMQSWVNCVKYARQFGHQLGEDYLELKYEDLCANPVEEVRRLFRSLDMPVRPEVEAFLRSSVIRSRIRKWQTFRFTIRENRDFANAVELGSPVLEELGYASR